VQDEVLSVAIPERYKLVALTIESGTDTQPHALVQLEIDGSLRRFEAIGDGAVDAAFRAIANATGTKSRLLRYSVNAITGGTDAQGEVTVRVQEREDIALGQGAHTDIIVASATAYVNALNRLEYRKKQGAKQGLI